MGTPSVREFKPTPHQLLKALELVSLANKVHYPFPRVNAVEDIKFIEAALLHGDKFCEDGEFEWSKQPDMQRPYWDWGVQKYHTKFVLCFKHRGCSYHDVTCRKFFTYGALIGLWHPDKLCWELVNAFKSDSSHE